jgi:hypothetical protein
LVAFQAANTPARFIERMLATVPGAQRVGDFTLADVVLIGSDSVQTAPTDRAAVIFGGSSGGTAAAGAAITTERHRLTEGTLWNGLLSSGPGAAVIAETDQPLVWQRDQPLVFLRQQGNDPHLVFNFDFAKSNADRLPAAVLILSRFLEDVQRRKVAPFAGNFETHQILPLPRGTDYELVRDGQGGAGITADAFLRAPAEPGFFRVRRGGAEFLTAAARFGDPREADFRDAETIASRLDRAQLIPRENLEGDPFTGLWMALIGAALVGSWAAQIRMQRAA